MSAMAVVMLTAAQAIADDAVSQSTMRKRQMIAQVVNCMKKRMSVDREISYNAASKVCKDQLNNQSNNSVSVALVASASPAKP
jgi:phosphohistidine phosphatase SixA